jgi:hypothetical protein
MAKSVAQSVIGAISKSAYKNALNTLGFKRAGMQLFMPSHDLFHVIRFDASQWGTASEGSFTVTLVVAIPTVHEYWTNSPFPKNPAASMVPIQQRVGFLMDDRKDIWWSVNGDTDVQALEREVTHSLIEYAVPFFTHYPDSLALLNQFRAGEKIPGVKGIHIPIVHSMLAKSHGFLDEAKCQIEKALEEAGTVEFKKEFAAEMGRRMELL